MYFLSLPTLIGLKQMYPVIPWISTHLGVSRQRKSFKKNRATEPILFYKIIFTNLFVNIYIPTHFYMKNHHFFSRKNNKVCPVQYTRPAVCRTCNL